MPQITPDTFHDLRRAPDSITVFTEAGEQTLQAALDGRWQGADVEVTTLPTPGGLGVTLSAPTSAVTRLRLRWRGRTDGIRLILGDAWERGYGDLEWRGVTPDRVLPWYWAAWDGHQTHSYGVRTLPHAFCFWQADSEGISLWADVRSGGRGVQLGARVLDVCEVLCRHGAEGESPFDALRAFCRQMCLTPRLPDHPVYGHNDWYYAYGNISAAQVREDAKRVVDLSPTGQNRPYAVIDAGWYPGDNLGGSDGGIWDRGNEKFPDMAGLAADITRIGARPGIWIRPLTAALDAPVGWRLSRDPLFLDPTVPEVREKIAADIARLTTWGYGLIKHDFTTDDIFGRWGFEMGATLTDEGWTFAEGQGRTTAEVILDLYRTIRAAAGSALIVGCNTVGHLSAGLFEMSRIGDDTSGQEWARTRKMGVNSLAFRAPQHGAFFVADADCVGITQALPWDFNRQWLDLLARSGTMTLVSLDPAALGPDQARDLRAAFALASEVQPLGEPLDWQETLLPCRWRFGNQEVRYDWVGSEGVSPF